MGELAKVLEEVSRSREEKTSKGQPWWLTLLLVVIPCVVTGFVSLRQSQIEADSASAKAEASYEATKKVVELLQSHDEEHVKHDAEFAAHIQVIEAWLSSMRQESGHGGATMPVPPNATNKRTWRPNFPAAIKPLANERRVKLPATIDDVVASIKSGHGDDYIKEIYEGPADGSPSWEKEFERRAAAHEKADAAARAAKVK